MVNLIEKILSEKKLETNCGNCSKPLPEESFISPYGWHYCSEQCYKVIVDE